MRSSELMRRRANMSIFDLGRIKSDWEDQRGNFPGRKKRSFILRLHVSFCISPRFLEDDLLSGPESVLFD